MTNQHTLIADIGGTNARFALAGQAPGEFKASKTLKCADYKTAELAISAYLQQQQIDHLDSLCFAAAGPIEDQAIHLTNNHWFIHMGQLREKFAVKSAHLLNDFEAISYALPHLTKSQLTSVGGNWDLPIGADLSLGVIGPGSGLGIGGFIKRGGIAYPLVTEGGHAWFSPENPYQIEVLNVLFNKYKRVSNERLLSGPGLVNIYQTICLIEGVTAKEVDAQEIGRLATMEMEHQCQKTLAFFFEVLGQVAGDVALTQCHAITKK